jgi:DNA-binding NtrC family response regulator
VHTEADNVRFPGAVLEVLPTSIPRRVTPGRAHQPLVGLVGLSGPWRSLCDDAHRFAAANSPILCEGEAGTGKFAVAQALQAQSGRSEPTVHDVASVLVDGWEQWLRTLRQALRGRGTVVVRHLHLCDAKLAAALAAEIDGSNPGGRLFGTVTRQNVQGPAIGSLLGRFPLRLEIPALRDRRDDVEALVACFANRYANDRSARFHPGAVAVLRAAEFAENARELEQLVAGLVATRRGDILAADLPPLSQGGPTHLTAMELAEREAIVKALRESKGNKAATAIRLGISRPTLYRKLATYGIDVSD